jgi:transcription elongation factor GreA
MDAMGDRAVPLTRDGLRRLGEELLALRTVKRPEVAERIHAAKDGTSTQNNAEYDDAKSEQAFIEGRILRLEQMIKHHTLIDEEEAHHGSTVRLGATVVVTVNGARREYTLVGSAEVDPATGRISNESPVGQALIGRRVGDTVQVMAPKGVMS